MKTPANEGRDDIGKFLIELERLVSDQSKLARFCGLDYEKTGSTEAFQVLFQIRRHVECLKQEIEGLGFNQ